MLMLWCYNSALIFFAIVGVTVVAAANPLFQTQHRHFNGSCTPAIVTVTNRGGLKRCADTIERFRNKGGFRGDIVVMHNEEDISAHEIIDELSKYRVQTKSFPKNEDLYHVPEFLTGHGPKERGINQQKAWIYFMKFNIFDPFFTNWCRVFYMDAGVKIHANLDPFFDDLLPEYSIYMGSDAYPHANLTHLKVLRSQFDAPGEKEAEVYKQAYRELTDTFKMDVDYPQSTIMYFDTRIIRDDPTIPRQLFDLQKRYPMGRTLDQAYIALYFTNVRQLWHRFPFLLRGRIPWDYCGNRRFPGGKSVFTMITKIDCPRDLFCLGDDPSTYLWGGFKGFGITFQFSNPLVLVSQLMLFLVGVSSLMLIFYFRRIKSAKFV